MADAEPDRPCSAGSNRAQSFIEELLKDEGMLAELAKGAGGSFVQQQQQPMQMEVDEFFQHLLPW